jgi:hypothetical protein
MKTVDELEKKIGYLKTDLNFLSGFASALPNEMSHAKTSLITWVENYRKQLKELSEIDTAGLE